MSTQTRLPLRPFQQRVLKAILQGKSVILQAPTGAGKTRAALAPFLLNLATSGNALPLTCRYAAPLRVLVNQFDREYHGILPAIDTYAPTRIVEKYQNIQRDPVAVQTGEQPQDPKWEAALTFCTIDQLVASFLAVPYGSGKRLANISVAGIIGSYLILDEFHLYPLLANNRSVFGARTTVIHLLRMLKDLTPFVLMTATFSKALLSELGTLLNAEVITVDDPGELAELAQGRQRVFSLNKEAMDASAILAEYQQRPQHRCTLVLCNTVWRAQQMYLRLKQAEAQGTRVLLLHSRFSQTDRTRLSREVEAALGPQSWQHGIYTGPDLLVIATQVVEVGLDISVHTLHTENAPANSLIQRAGRCARFAHQQGIVQVYPLPEGINGQSVSTQPYAPQLCEATWQAMTDLGFDGQPVGYLEEQQLIDAVHAEQDQELLQRYIREEGTIQQKIFESFGTNDRSVTSSLIRDVAQVHLIIANDPDAITEEPWRWQTFGMHPDALASTRRWDALQARAATLGLEWVCQEALPLKEQTSDGEESPDTYQKTTYEWQEIANRHRLSQALIIALPSELARYDPNLGFVLLDGLDGREDLSANGYESPLLPEPVKKRARYGSQVTSYQDHIQGLVRAYQAILKEDLRFIARRLEQAMGLTDGLVDQAIRLAIGCHDLGKLDRSWQAWALAWQTLLYQRHSGWDYQLPHPDFCFAKTDSDGSKQQRAWQADLREVRPRHACESVWIARKLIAASLGVTSSHHPSMPVVRAVCGAIARHHSSQASEYAAFVLEPRVLPAIGEALKIAQSGASWTFQPALLSLIEQKGGDLSPEAQATVITRPDERKGDAGELELWLSFVIVRALRLADQRA